VSLVLGATLVAAPSAGGARLPGATTYKACAGAGSFWPTQTLALDGANVWVACKEQARLVRVNTKTRKIGAAVGLDGPVIAVAVGYGSIWALDSASTLYRIKPATARVLRRVDVPASAAYNVWIGGGSVWVADDQGATVVRVAPATGKVVARVAVGDGPADMVFSETNAWVISHRDRALDRIDLATNAVSRVAAIPGDAPERLARLAGSLWITGRGTDLLRVDPQTGAVKATIDIGASGIDVVAGAGVLWVPSRSDVVDRTGFPTMEALRRVSASTGRVTTVARASGRLDVHGLQAGGGFVWLADNRAGLLYRVHA
jgi:streptogramin lyase